jgi:hypothetical protein
LENRTYKTVRLENRTYEVARPVVHRKMHLRIVVPARSAIRRRAAHRDGHAAGHAKLLFLVYIGRDRTGDRRLTKARAMATRCCPPESSSER